MVRTLLHAKAVYALVLAAVIGVGTSPVIAGTANGGKPSVRRSWKEVTRASWYGRSFSGRPTASGTRFNPHRLTAAHRTLRLGSRVRVTELRSGRSVVVQITDRGPYVRGRGIDLSYAAARQLGMVDRGVARVEIELLKPNTGPRQPIMVASAGTSSPWVQRALVE